MVEQQQGVPIPLSLVKVPSFPIQKAVVLSVYAEFLYKTTDYETPSAERSIRWDDPDLAIDWQLHGTPQLSAKYQAAVFLKDAEVFA